jgi:hypothetical protein
MKAFSMSREYEHALQSGCVLWFNLQYPQYAGLLFAVPNGGFRSKRTAVKIKEEGGVSGVADLILLIPTEYYSGLCIEMKVGKNKQSENQKQWGNKVTTMGYAYIVIRTFDSFKELVETYIRYGVLPQVCGSASTNNG